MICTFYECTNADCKFRFPLSENTSFDRTCPKCKSLVNIITSIGSQDEEISRRQSTVDSDVVVLLDNIRSALNVGSMLRTADGFGVRHLYLCGITPTPEMKNVTKSSLGAEKYIHWTYEKNAVDRINKLKDREYFIVSIEEHRDAQSLFAITHQALNQPSVLVVGNEVCGIDPEILELSDLILKIPMSGVKKSLNVAVAFGIAVSMLHYSYLNRSSDL